MEHYKNLFLLNKQNDRERVLKNPKTNRPYNSDLIAHEFKKICNSVNIPNIGFHGLRHTVGTRLVESGVDLAVVKDLLAHSTIRTTERYLHSTEERKLNAVKILENY